MSSEAPGSPGVGSQLAGADASRGFCSGSPFQSPARLLCPWSSQHLRQSFSLWTVTPAAWGLERPQEQGGWSAVGTANPMTRGSSLLDGDGVDVPLLWPWRLVWDTATWPLEAWSAHLSARLHQGPDQLCPLCHSAACCSAARAHSKFRSFLRSPCRRFPFPWRVCYSVPSRQLCGSHGFAAGRRPRCLTHPGSEPGGWQVARCSALNASARRRAVSEGMRVAREASEVAEELRDRAGQGREAGRMWHLRRKHARGCRRALLFDAF